MVSGLFRQLKIKVSIGAPVMNNEETVAGWNNANVNESIPLHGSTPSTRLPVTHARNPLQRHFRLIVVANRIFPPNFGPDYKTTFLIKNYPRAGRWKQWAPPRQFNSLDGNSAYFLLSAFIYGKTLQEFVAE